jgi:UDP-2-acetamido-2,6-beta-L-arabino-hexul-4-ose reductase
MKKKRVGITGQAGFMGTHLANYLTLKEEIQLIPFEDEFFSDSSVLQNFVSQCDAIVHLAAMNRHGDPQVIYDTNIKLVQQLIDALEYTNSKPHVIMSSSTQEERDNSYGRSKKQGRAMLVDWASRHGANFTGMIIPNVFGPFGKPFYNSVVSTFAWQLNHDQKPKIEVDASLELIYINDLLEEFYKIIINRRAGEKMAIAPLFEFQVSELLVKMQKYYQSYIEGKTFPDLTNYSDICLFNTFRSYLESDYFPVSLKLHQDERGSFVETVKAESAGQFSFSTTKPGITRGNHFHIRKVERFAVINGEAVIRLRKIGTTQVIEYHLSGDRPAYVDIPVWYTHNITNPGKYELVTLFWINEFYNPDDPDTFFEEV